MFKEVCPTVYNLLDKIVNNPVKQGEMTPSFAFIYENFLADLKVSLLSDNDSVELIDKIGEAIEILRGNNSKEHKESQSIHFVDIDGDDAPAEILDFSFDDLNIKQTYLEEPEKAIKAVTKITPEQNCSSESRRGKSWTEDEENLIRLYYEQGKDFLTIASLIGRTEVAIKSRLAKLGLIDYTYGQDNTVPTPTIIEARKLKDENDFLIDNSSNRASILDKNGQLVFVTDGKMKFCVINYIG